MMDNEEAVESRASKEDKNTKEDPGLVDRVAKLAKAIIDLTLQMQNLEYTMHAQINKQETVVTEKLELLQLGRAQ